MKLAVGTYRSTYVYVGTSLIIENKEIQSLSVRKNLQERYLRAALGYILVHNYVYLADALMKLKGRFRP